MNQACPAAAGNGGRYSALSHEPGANPARLDIRTLAEIGVDMSPIRKILGGVTIGGQNHAVGKLENGKFAAGFLHEGKDVDASHQFESISTAFDHWHASLPDGESAATPVKSSWPFKPA
jgi:hypothetical protein